MAAFSAGRAALAAVEMQLPRAWRARRSDRGSVAVVPDRRRAPVHRKSRMSSNSSNDSREEYVRPSVFCRPANFPHSFAGPLLGT